MKDTNIFEHQGHVTRIVRQDFLEQKSACLWFTGLSASGKSTIAVEVERALLQKNKISYRLDGDNMRLGINSNLGFSAQDRQENIRRVSETSKLICDIGIITLSSFISPYISDRDQARKIHEDAAIDFLEIYVFCPLDVAEDRDPKGLYKKARSGEIKNFTGISDPYEEPKKPELILRTDRLTLQQEVDAVLNLLNQRGLV